MRLHTLSLAVLSFSLALSVGASERRSSLLKTSEVGLETGFEATERLRVEILLQIELARPVLGDEATGLLQERARFALRIEQLEFVAEDSYQVTEQVLEGNGEGGALLLRSPSALLARDETPRVQQTNPGRIWTRGSWMDSPDGVK